MLTNKKKVIILSFMVVLLVATGIVNVLLNWPPETPVWGDEIEAGDFFINYKADRISTRNQSVQYLDAIIENEASSEEAVAEATAKKMEIASIMEQELVLEGLIKALGFEDCVVTMSTNNINVLLKSGELSETDIARILYTVVTETGEPATSVKLIPVL